MKKAMMQANVTFVSLTETLLPEYIIQYLTDLLIQPWAELSLKDQPSMPSPQQVERFAATTLGSERGVPHTAHGNDLYDKQPVHFCFMENSLLWTCICIYIDKGVLTPGIEDKLVSYPAWKSVPMDNMKTWWFFSSKHIITAKIFDANKERGEMDLSDVSILQSLSYLTSSHRLGERTRAEGVPWAAPPCALT